MEVLVNFEMLIILALIFFICGLVAGVSLTRPRVGR